MTRFPPSLLATATLCCACATAQGPAGNDAPWGDLSSEVRTYWLGQRPPCTVQPLRAIAATSENDLRRAAAALGGDAVMAVRSSVTWPERTRANQQMMLSPTRTYTGVAVRLSARCHA